MKKTLMKSVLLCLCGVFSFSGAIYGQTIEGRRSFMDPDARTTNDPRRIPLPPGLEGPDGSIVITGGRIFDGTGAPARDGSVVIERNRITAILPAGSTDWPQGARVIDVAGKTVMPGMIAMHEHITEAVQPTDDGNTVLMNEAVLTLTAMENLRWYVESGVTTVRDAASHGSIPFRLKEAVAENRIPGPRLFAVGQTWTGTGGHSAEGKRDELDTPLFNAEGTYDGPDEWRRGVREQFNMGADLIKITNHYNLEEVTAAVEEAHDLGIKVIVDAGYYYLEWAVVAGVDCIEHTYYRTDETLSIMVEKGIDAVPTIAGGHSNPAAMEMFRRMKEAGIKMGVGVDNGAEVDLHPTSYIRELKTFVEGGYTIPEALVAATKTGAEILDMGR